MPSYTLKQSRRPGVFAAAAAAAGSGGWPLDVLAVLGLVASLLLALLQQLLNCFRKERTLTARLTTHKSVPKRCLRKCGIVGGWQGCSIAIALGVMC